MDPIDDRVMMKRQQQGEGGCLLGYNTHHGLRIDIKLRTDDLSGFRDYPDLASTLIHELSPNWVGDHNLLFWTNYAQMKSEYVCTHARLRRSALVVRGKKTYELAGLNEQALNNVFHLIMNELMREMGQHGLHPNMIADPIRQRIRQLEDETLRMESQQGYRLGGVLSTNRMSNTASGGSTVVSNNSTDVMSERELAWAAAERRAREQKEKEKEKRNDKV